MTKFFYIRVCKRLSRLAYVGRFFESLYVRYINRSSCYYLRPKVFVYVGRHGSFKTFCVVHDAVRERANIVSNLPIAMHDSNRVSATVQELADFYRFGRHCACIVDEIGTYANSHDWQSMPREFRDFMINVRRYHSAVFMSAQRFRQSDVAIKNVVWEVRLPFAVSIPFLGWILPDTHRKSLICEDGSVIVRGDLPGFGTVIFHQKVDDKDMREIDAMHDKYIVRGGWRFHGVRLYSQSLADRYDSRKDMSFVRNYDKKK